MTLALTLSIIALVLALAAVIITSKHGKRITKIYEHSCWVRQLGAKEFTETDQRVQALEQASVEQHVYGRPAVDLNSADDVLDLWNAIVETEKRENRP